jgi:hypothetical protein
MIRATPAGRKAQEVWRPLFGTIERRWQARFGKREVHQLRESLWALISKTNVELPDSLPAADSRTAVDPNDQRRGTLKFFQRTVRLFKGHR